MEHRGCGWLAYSPRDHPCMRRRTIALEILGTELRDLDITTRKIKIKYGAALHEAAAGGYLLSIMGQRLWVRSHATRETKLTVCLHKYCSSDPALIRTFG